MVRASAQDTSGTASLQRCSGHDHLGEGLREGTKTHWRDYIPPAGLGALQGITQEELETVVCEEKAWPLLEILNSLFFY